jgi:hypothetical protein
VAVGETDAAGGQRVEVRRGNVLTAVKTDIGVAHVIADDHQDVGLAIGGGQRRLSEEQHSGKS